MSDYEIHPELSGLHRALTPLEVKQLEENILDDDCIIDPIVTWKHEGHTYILDGRHRLPIAQKYGVSFATHEVELENMDAAKLWVVSNQLGKRNLTEKESQRLRAEQALLLGDTAAVAEDHGVSRRTVQRDVEILEIQQMMADDVLEMFTTGETRATRKDWQRYGKLSARERGVVDTALRKHKGLTLAMALPKEKTDITPADIVRVRNCKTLSDHQKSDLAHGRIYANHDSVKRFLALDAEDQIVVDHILYDDEVETLDSAVDALQTSLKAKDPKDKTGDVKKKIAKSGESLCELIMDLHAVEPNQALFDGCVKTLSDLLVQLSEWVPSEELKEE